MRVNSNLMPADAHLRVLVILSNCVLRYLRYAALEPGMSSIGCRRTVSVAIRCSEMGLDIFS